MYRSKQHCLILLSPSKKQGPCVLKCGERKEARHQLWAFCYLLSVTISHFFLAQEVYIRTVLT